MPEDPEPNPSEDASRGGSEGGVFPDFVVFPEDRKSLWESPRFALQALLVIAVYGLLLRFAMPPLLPPLTMALQEVLLLLPVLLFYARYFKPEIAQVASRKEASTILPLGLLVIGCCILWPRGWVFISFLLRVVLSIAFLFHFERTIAQSWGEKLTAIAAQIRARTSTTMGVVISVIWILVVLVTLVIIAGAIFKNPGKTGDNRYTILWLPVLGFYVCARMVEDFTKPDWLRSLLGNNSTAVLLGGAAVYCLFITQVGVFDTLATISFFGNGLAVLAFASEVFKTLDGPPKSGEELLSSLRTHGRGSKLEKTPKDWLPTEQPGETFVWGSRLVSLKKAREHFLIHGTTGAGKTSIIRLLMQSSFAKKNAKGIRMRAVISDPKRELVPILKGMGVEMPIHILNPFDQRSVSWAVSKDITDDARAITFAHMLVPEVGNKSGNEHSYFVPVTRQLIAEMVRVLNFYAPRKWMLRDLILAFKNIKVMMALFNSRETSKDQLEHFTGDPETAANLRGSIKSKLEPFEIVAAVWDCAKKSISVDEWIQSESILLLGSYEKASKVTNLTNGLFLDACTTGLLSLPNDNPDYTWVILDEVAKSGKLPGLEDLLTQGRSKGACVVLACQDVLSIKDVYGEDIYDVMLGMCNNRALLRAASERACEWSSKQIGEAEVIQESYGFTSGSSSGSSSSTSSGSSSNFAITTTRAVLPSTFKDLARLDEEGLEGYFTVAGGSTSHTQVGKELFWKRISPASNDPGFIERSPEEQQLKPWTKEDTERLGIQSIVDPVLFPQKTASQPPPTVEEESKPHPVWDVVAPLTKGEKNLTVKPMSGGGYKWTGPNWQDLMEPAELREIDWQNYLTAMKAAMGAEALPDEQIREMFNNDYDVVLPREKALWKAALEMKEHCLELMECAHEMGYRVGKCTLQDVINEFQRRNAN